MKPLPLSYYQDGDVVSLSRDLLGKSLFTSFDGHLTGGIIVETEAYAGPEDRASHAYNNRRTKRTEVMFGAGGHAYAYLCYGMHVLFNIVTNVKGIPHGVLIRAIEPTHGMDEMLRRRKLDRPTARLCSGPGTLSQALGITVKHKGHPLNRAPIWVEASGMLVEDSQIIASPRIGIDYAGDWAQRPWRFQLILAPPQTTYG